MSKDQPSKLRQRTLRRRSAALEAQTHDLQQAQAEAEAESRAKSSFLANMSHEMRTPLNAILGFSEMLRDGLAGPPGPTWSTYAGYIHQAGSLLLAIINDVLDLSRIEAGRMEIDKNPVDVDSVVKDCLELLSLRAEQGGLSLSSFVAPKLPPLFADPLRLKQILLNLLSNAIKFTAPGGAVAIAVKWATLDSIEFSVTDTGIGMTPDELKIALEPFGQVDSGFVRKQDGAGLGLPLALRLTELHGGTLTVGSEKGVGTRATIRLPLNGRATDTA